MPIETQFVEIREVALALKCSEDHVRRKLILTGKLPAIRLGRRSWRIEKADFDRWREQEKIAAANALKKHGNGNGH